MGVEEEDERAVRTQLHEPLRAQRQWRVGHTHYSLDTRAALAALLLNHVALGSRSVREGLALFELFVKRIRLGCLLGQQRLGRGRLRRLRLASAPLQDAA